MKGLVVGAAPAAARHVYYRDVIRAHTGPVIAVDGGCDLCHAAGRAPDILLGDLDSASAAGIAYARASGAAMRTAPAEKDLTDLDIALEVAKEISCDTVVVIATWTGRLDHTLAATGSVMRVCGIAVDLADPHMTGCVLDASTRPAVSLAGSGALFSILTLAPGAIVSCAGARYPLRHTSLDPLSSRGISNVVEQEPAVVRADSGRVLLISHAAAGVAAVAISDYPVHLARAILGP